MGNAEQSRRSIGPFKARPVGAGAGLPLRFQGFSGGFALGGVSRPDMTAAYAYDGEDRRTMKTVDGVITRTLWSGADEVAEMDGAGNILRRFIPDGSGAMDGRLATLEPNGTIYWHHTDHQGSVVATSNASGAPVSLVNYSPNGELGTAPDGSALAAPPTGSPFGYTGRQYDPETGLWQYRARYYHPQLGQFLSTDPIGTKDDPNLYLYVGNDPVNRTDPTGNESAAISVWASRCETGQTCSLAPGSEGYLQTVQAIHDDPWVVIDAIFIAIDVATVPSGEGVVFAAARRSAFAEIRAIIHGKAQFTRYLGRGSGHAMRSLREAVSMARSGNYRSVHMNRTISSITDGNVRSRLRPDVAAVRPDGKVDIREIASGRQEAAALRDKYASALGDRAGNIEVTRATTCRTGTRIC